jgi:hypothetical protein
MSGQDMPGCRNRADQTPSRIGRRRRAPGGRVLYMVKHSVRFCVHATRRPARSEARGRADRAGGRRGGHAGRDDVARAHVAGRAAVADRFVRARPGTVRLDQPEDERGARRLDLVPSATLVDRETGRVPARSVAEGAARASGHVPAIVLQAGSAHGRHPHQVERRRRARPARILSSSYVQAAAH